MHCWENLINKSGGRGGGGGGGGFQLPRFAAISTFCPFLSFSRHFLGSQTPSEDDNSKDERLKPFPP